jgi:hypothetical protein
MNEQRFIKISDSFFIDADYKQTLAKLGLTSIDTVFSFNAGKNLSKNNLAGFRSRIQFETSSPSVTFFLKRYDKPSLLTQFKNWLSHRKIITCSLCDLEPAKKLIQFGINTPKTIAYGQERGILFEKRSFIITEKIPDAQSLEKKLPSYFYAPPAQENIRLRKTFIAQLASFVQKFHQTGYRHRDLYLAHIFHSDSHRFYLIDLARCFKPILSAERFRLKDVTQLYYSAPAKYFSNTDRLRFYLNYSSRTKLTDGDKSFIRSIINKANRMAKHDARHGRIAPFAK